MKILGKSGTVTVDSVDYGIEKISFKHTTEKNEYYPIGTAAGVYPTQIVGGMPQANGEFEMAADDAQAVSSLINPTSLYTIVINIGSGKSLSFEAAIWDADLEKSNKGLTKWKFNYSVSGTVTLSV